MPELDEIDFGNLEGLAHADARIAATLRQWASGDWAARVGADGESGADVAARVHAALARLATESYRAANAANGLGGGVVVAVAHSSYLRVFLALACGLPLAAGLALDQRNGCLDVLEVSLDLRFDDGRGDAGACSSSSHVEATCGGGNHGGLASEFIPPATALALNQVDFLGGLVRRKQGAAVAALQDAAAAAACAYTQQRRARSGGL
jgi:hypothetical protein